MVPTMDGKRQYLNNKSITFVIMPLSQLVHLRRFNQITFSNTCVDIQLKWSYPCYFLPT